MTPSALPPRLTRQLGGPQLAVVHSATTGTPESEPEGRPRTGMNESRIREGLTFDDVLLVPAASDVLPAEVDVATQLTR